MELEKETTSQAKLVKVSPPFIPTSKVDDFSVDILLKRRTGLTNRLLVLTFAGWY